MKLHGSDVPAAVIDGAQEATEFSLKFTGGMAKLLSANLYSDARKAIMRELSCNAWDAHIEANLTDTPFQIDLPGRFRPELIIRDFGAGLSHDQAMNLYTTYGESTKTDSNDGTGCLGLGSKSPLGYTNNFTVTSYQNGTGRAYAIFINPETDLPNCSASEPFETNEADGLEVRIPTQDGDYRQWEEVFKKVIQVFPLAPECKDVELPTIPARETWGSVTILSEYVYGYHYKDWLVKMGNVIYPLDTDQISKNITCKLDGVTGLLEVPMGAVAFTPDRDSLYYTDRTIKAVEERLEEFIELYCQSFIDEMNAIDSYADWAELAKRVQVCESMISKNDVLISDFKNVGRYQKFKLVGVSDADFQILSDAEAAGQAQGLYEKAKELGLSNEANWAWQMGRLKYHSGPRSTYDWYFGECFLRPKLENASAKAWRYQIENTRSHGRLVGNLESSLSGGGYYSRGFDHIDIIVNDFDHGALLATRRWLRAERPFGVERHDEAFVVYVDDETRLDEVKKIISVYDVPVKVTKLSTTSVLDHRTKSVTTRNPKVSILSKNYDYDGSSHKKPATWERGLDRDEVLSSFYKNHAWVQIKKYEPIGSELAPDFDALSSMAIKARDFGIEGIVAVKECDVELFENDPNWMHIDHAADRRYTERLNALTEEQVFGHWLAVEFDSQLHMLTNFLEKYEDDVAIAADLIDPMRGVCRQGIHNFHEIVEAAERLGIEISSNDASESKARDVAESLKKVYNEVPALDHLMDVVGGDKVDEDVVKIINKFTEA